MKNEVLLIEKLCSDEGTSGGLDDVTLLIREGECFSLAGYENSGRKLLAHFFKGGYRPKSGRVLICGKELTQWTQQELEQNRVFYIDAKPPFVGSFDLAENFFLLRRNRLDKFKLNQTAIHIQTQSCLEQLGLDYATNADISELGNGDKRMLSIARAVDRRAKLIVLDNVTSGLLQSEIDKLILLLKKVKQQGIAMLIADNRDDGFDEIADSLVVMKNGGVEKKLFDKNKYQLRDILMKADGEPESAPICEKQESVYSENIKFSFSLNSAYLEFEVRSGQMILLRTETAQELDALKSCIFCEKQGCKISFSGKSIAAVSVKRLMKNKIALWDGSLGVQSLEANMTVSENVLLPSMPRISRLGFYRKAASRIFADVDFWHNEIAELQTKQVAPEVYMQTMLCRWKLFNPRVLVLYNVFSLADKQNRQVLQTALRELCARGTAVLILDSASDYCALTANTIVTL